MTIHDGVVTLADDDIPVVVELDDDHVRLTASGTEIGEWRIDECQISHLDETTFSISAENETLQFVPTQPDRFAAAVNGDLDHPAPSPPVTSTPSREMEPTPSETESEGATPMIEIHDAPPPKPITVSLFYALSLVTAGLGVWALISIIF